MVQGADLINRRKGFDSLTAYEELESIRMVRSLPGMQVKLKGPGGSIPSLSADTLIISLKYA